MILEHLNETSPLAAVGVLLTVFVGACIQATIGVGFGLAVAPVLFFIRPDLVLALVIILGMSSAFRGIVGDQKHAFALMGVANSKYPIQIQSGPVFRWPMA